MSRYLQFFASVLLLFGAPLRAQTSAINGQIEGTITDATGAAVAKAQVAVDNQETGFRQQQESNESGFYRFQLLPLGSYKVTVTAPGFQPITRNIASLTAGSTATVNITVEVQSGSTLVEVTAAAPVAEPSRTTIGSTLSSNQVQNLPLVSRNPYNFILLQPGVAGRPNTEFGVPRRVNTNGFNGRINYQIDGGNNTQSDRAGIRLIPFSNTFVQEVEQVSNGFAPEFGNTVGTVFNTITRSGTNQVHGEGAYLFRRTDFSARPALLAEGRPVPQTNVDTFFGNSGFPVIKDKLFGFAGVERVKRDLPQVVSVAPNVIQQLGLPANYANAIPFSQNVLFFMGKLDYLLNSSNRLSLRFNGHRNDSPYNAQAFNGLTVLSQTYNFVDRSYVGSAQLISTLSPTIVNELRLQVPYRLQRQVPFEATGLGPSITIPGVIQFGGSPGLGFIYKEVTPELFNNTSFSFGNHTAKVGYNFRTIRDRQTQASAITYTFPNVAAYLAAANGSAPFGYTNFAQGLGQPSLVYNTNFHNFFVQDNWKARPNLTLVYGLRYDLYVPPKANAQAPYENSRNFPVDKNNFGPRLGIAWGLGKQQKTVVRASTGIFYDAPQTDLYRRALLNTGGALPVNLSLGNTAAGAPAFPNFFTSLPPALARAQDVQTVSRDFRNLYSINANASVTRELTASTAVTVTYLFTRGNRLPVYRNVNLIPNGQFLADGRPLFGAGRVDPRFNNVLVAESVGQSVYHGANITLNRRFSKGVEAFATYTWSQSIDDAPERNNIDSGDLLPSDPTNRRRDRGFSLTDRRNNFTLSTIIAPEVAPGGFWRALARHNNLGVQLVAISGDRFNIGTNRPLNGDQSIPNNLQRPLFVGRNTYRGPSTVELNVRYTRRIPITERFATELIAESTNLLNRTNVNNVNTIASVDTLGNITAQPSYAWTGALDQRLIQLGVRVRF